MGFNQEIVDPFKGQQSITQPAVNPMDTPIQQGFTLETPTQKRATMFEQVSALTYQAKEFTQNIRQQLAQETLVNPYLKYQDPTVIKSELGIDMSILRDYTEDNTYIDTFRGTLARATEFKEMDWGTHIVKGKQGESVWLTREQFEELRPSLVSYILTGKASSGTDGMRFEYKLWTRDYEQNNMEFNDWVKAVAEYAKDIQQKVKDGYYFEETDPAITSLNTALKKIAYIQKNLPEWMDYNSEDYWHDAYLRQAFEDVKKRQQAFIKNVMLTKEYEDLKFDGYGDYAHYPEGTVRPDQYANPNSPYYIGAQPHAIMATISTLIKDWALSLANVGISNWEDLLNMDKLMPTLIGAIPATKTSKTKYSSGTRLQQGSLGQTYEQYKMYKGLDDSLGNVISRNAKNLLNIIFKGE